MRAASCAYTGCTRPDLHYYAERAEIPICRGSIGELTGRAHRVSRRRDVDVPHGTALAQVEALQDAVLPGDSEEAWLRT